MVQVYNAAEALPNFVNPFWMLPLMGSYRCQGEGPCGLFHPSADPAYAGSTHHAVAAREDHALRAAPTAVGVGDASEAASLLLVKA